jgi:uncharacterized protein
MRPMSTTVPFTLGSLHGLLDLPDEPGERPAVIVCHGFKGFLDWGFFPYLAALLADRGFVVVRFNVSGAGMLPGDDLVTDPDAFRANTHGRELADLLAVLAATGETLAPGRVDRTRLGLFGHSRGGGNAVLAAAQEPVRALVTWASVASFDRYTPEQKDAWRRDGQFPVINARTGQQLALGLALLEDLEAHRAELDIQAAAAQRRAPWLIVHGGRDESVPAAEGERLAGIAAQSAAPAELLRIPEADHTFGSRHPFTGPSPWLIQALNATQRWFLRHL